jgi:hypothetical protein
MSRDCQALKRRLTCPPFASNHPKGARSEEHGWQCGGGMVRACVRVTGLEEPVVSKVLQADDVKLSRQ